MEPISVSFEAEKSAPRRKIVQQAQRGYSCKHPPGLGLLSKVFSSLADFILN